MSTITAVIAAFESTLVRRFIVPTGGTAPQLFPIFRLIETSGECSHSHGYRMGFTLLSDDDALHADFSAVHAADIYVLRYRLLGTITSHLERFRYEDFHVTNRGRHGFNNPYPRQDTAVDEPQFPSLGGL